VVQVFTVLIATVVNILVIVWHGSCRNKRLGGIDRCLDRIESRVAFSGR
jgi:hypothetical protein